VCKHGKAHWIFTRRPGWFARNVAGNIRQDIPVMLIDEGDKWVETAMEDLPVPPPEK